MSLSKLNVYDKKIIFVIALLSLGVIGGALQPIRLFSILTVPYNIKFIISRLSNKKILKTYFIGVLWIIYGIISLSWVTDTVNAKIELLYVFLHYNLIFSILRYAYRANNPIMAVSFGWLICVSITVVLGLYEFITNHHFYTSVLQAGQSDSGVAINGIRDKKFVAVLFNNYNEYVTLLAYSLPFLFQLLIKLNNIKWQIIIWTIVLITFAFTSVNGSRGGLLCYIIAVFFLIIQIKKLRFKYKKLTLFIILLVIFVLLVIARDFLFSDINERLANTTTVEDLGRISIYDEAIRLLHKSNYMGIGPWGFQSIVGFAPHSLLLEILSQYGLVVFIPLAVFWSKIFLQIIKSKECINGICMFIIFLVASFINSGYLHFAFTWIFFASIIVYDMSIIKK